MGKVEERRARVTDAIVAAATEVMAESGAAALSLGEVARRVGMRTPSLYGYFGSRGELCDEIFRRGWIDYGRLTAGLEITAGTDLREELRSGILASVSWANDNRAAAELMFWRPIPNWRPASEAFAPAIEMVARTTRIVADAQSVGLLRADAEVTEMSELLGVIFSGVISQQLSNEPGVRAEDGRISRHAGAFADMFMSHYGSTEEA
ncbi:TetR/AcrR family transcriptional regulator [Granulicoccus sp. GXG6511]|uniref:TetR/AcrR family transcriptional regulator n=1 Tax=Granulicoccus sp. GXG6511 TaxID=3381351 RepID=UPI003D7CF9B2